MNKDWEITYITIGTGAARIIHAYGTVDMAYDIAKNNLADHEYIAHII